MADGWYSRPVFFVTDVEQSVAFYRDQLGFAEENRYEEHGKALVAQVRREDCTLLFDCQQPDRTGRGRMFISLDPEPLAQLRAEFEQRGAPLREGRWGYRTLIVDDPDGNQLYFPYPADSPGTG